VSVQEVVEAAAQTPVGLISVLGCTGTVGSAVMRLLATRECAVRGVLRRPHRVLPVARTDERAHIRYAIADHRSTDELSRAFEGSDVLLLSTGTGPDQGNIESRAIRAAQRAGVRRIVKISAPLVEPPAAVEAARSHRAVEAVLEASGLEHCSLRPTAFMQNWLRNAAPIAHTGTVYGSCADARRNHVDARDVASVAVALLLSRSPLPATALSVTGPELLSHTEMSERLSSVTGFRIRHRNLSGDEHHRLLRSAARLPEWLARHIVELDACALLTPDTDTTSGRALLGRYPRTMDEFLEEHRAAFLPAPAWARWSRARTQRARL
jgi:uncharacterized protein YbjT (DUF2867 family)